MSDMGTEIAKSLIKITLVIALITWIIIFGIVYLITCFF